MHSDGAFLAFQMPGEVSHENMLSATANPGGKKIALCAGSTDINTITPFI